MCETLDEIHDAQLDAVIAKMKNTKTVKSSVVC